MDDSSILMLYQYFPREDHHEYLHRRSEELKEKSDGIKWQLRKWEKIGFTKERTKVLKEKIAELDIERSRVHGLKRMLT